MHKSMMSELDRWLMRIFKAFLALLILWALWVSLMWWNRPRPLPPPVSDEATRRYFAERHEFHGISSSTTDLATGEQYFWRNGEKCRL